MLSKERKRANTYSRVSFRSDSTNLPGATRFPNLEEPRAAASRALRGGRGQAAWARGPGVRERGGRGSEISRTLHFLFPVKLVLLGADDVRGGVRGWEKAGRARGHFCWRFHGKEDQPPERGSFKASRGGNRDWKDAAYLNVSLFRRLNLERSSFTFSSLWGVTLCFQKRMIQLSLFDLGVQATIASVNTV